MPATPSGKEVRIELRAISYELGATRERMKGLAQRLRRTRGYRRGRAGSRAEPGAEQTALAWTWVAAIGAALLSLNQARRELKGEDRRRRRRP